MLPAGFTPLHEMLLAHPGAGQARRSTECFALCADWRSMKSLSHSPQDYEVVLMVGAGIGVTPFASVLADLVNRLNSKKCKLCKKVRPTRTCSPKHRDASGAHPAVRAAVWYQMH